MRLRVTPPARALGTGAPLHSTAIVSTTACIFVLAGAIVPAWSATAAAAPNGTISGYVLEAGREADATAVPLGYAHVFLEGTERRIVANGEGYFEIPGVVPGDHFVRATYVGHAGERVAVRVGAGETVRVTIRLVVTAFTLPEVPVTDRRHEAAQPTSTPTTNIDKDLLDAVPIDDPTEAVVLSAGVVMQGGEIHVRGNRSSGTDQRIDGVSVKDPLGGRAGGISTMALEDTEVIVGAMQAKHGPTLSGVINYKTREGGERVEGRIQYETDDFGAPDKTFTDLDRVLVGIGGPLPVERMTYYLSAQGTWTDAYPATAERRDHRRVLDFISLGERKVNDVRLQGKIAWSPDIPTKITYEHLANRTRRDQYFHNWSWQGYVQSFQDTLDTGEVRTRNGAWASHRIDEDYAYYNAAEHTPDIEERFSLRKISYRRTFLGGDAFLTAKLAHTTYLETRSVQGKAPWAYDIDTSQDPYLDYAGNEISDFFARGGDLPEWSASESKVTSLHVDHTHRIGRHLIEVGGILKYNDLAVQNVSSMFIGRDLGEPIGVRDRYHVYQTEGGIYLQDTWEHEGMVLNVGARYDGYSVGQQLEVSEVRDRVKWQLSPRIGLAYPITTRDVFSFQYGRYYQYPQRHQLYENRSALDGRIIGNPDLEPETTVAYQAAIQHVFGRSVRGQFAVYYQDVFGLIDQKLVETVGSAAEVPQYTNEAYASSRGFEVTLSRAFAGGLTGQLSYTYGVATGVASDPNTSSLLGLRYVPISEQPLDWDRRHGFGAAFVITDPAGRWSLGGTVQLQSGFPYTPRERATRDVEPETVNSRRLPGTSTLSLQGSKHVSLWGRELRAFVRADNVLDARSIATLDGVTPLPSPAFDPAYYLVYYNETGNAGGAYLGEDQDGDGQEDWVPLNDPRTLTEGRAIRVGLSMAF